MSFFVGCSNKGKFHHIQVFKDRDGCYGLVPPYEFDSLVTLIMYYATNGLKQYYPNIEAKLQYPVFYHAK